MGTPSTAKMLPRNELAQIAGETTANRRTLYLENLQRVALQITPDSVETLKAEVAALELEVVALEAQVATLEAQLATARVVRLYGASLGLPTAAQPLFEAGIEMDGDEVFPNALANNLGSVTIAPTADATFVFTVNGLARGAMLVAAGTLVGSWTMTGTYTAAAGDVINFLAPSPPDATLSGPRYTFVGTRS